ncbi:MAG: hypothetical protein N4A57_05390 [Anaeromicrobium sp.]|jgi:predicted transposase/invertase (TIGR01784 family)|uniref:hypothetical protein n=1 Tax=Anaeromicrobium sp. TaxID=1929132 RepID=UPI0025CDE21D|nr:hypothetical protein [Anaeromicrobium sp.]MCT4593686.1 hypothetical protein [Anaeromicrobium sp.]
MTKTLYDLEVEKSGIEKGIEKGIIKGKIEMQIAIAKNLIGLGLSIDKIVEATKLSREEIEKLYN